MAPTDYFPTRNAPNDTYSALAEYITNVSNEFIIVDIPDIQITKHRHERQMNLYKKPQNYCARKTIIARPREIRSKAI